MQRTVYLQFSLRATSFNVKGIHGVRLGDFHEAFPRTVRAAHFKLGGWGEPSGGSWSIPSNILTRRSSEAIFWHFPRDISSKQKTITITSKWKVFQCFCGFAFVNFRTLNVLWTDKSWTCVARGRMLGMRIVCVYIEMQTFWQNMTNHNLKSICKVLIDFCFSQLFSLLVIWFSFLFLSNL